ncbi:E3 SUMO-protein ligase SIZ1 isoform X1 [Hevea brasiliensis]|nr:E3 SUMO-protein ligase SIZ1 isoform X1 [Hevea brasiliensis]XP_021683815.2 E3 SUMO-protein ligase SIZ1 isoform X1 [Hevea brasiliensis]XP_057998955.1 E3 SUMO-protein ligase SIZ1 isoform X1 [Hevea brasiliensis]
MDLVTSCKDKLAYFRIKELKDVLTQLGLSKQGKKQDLVDRILAVLSDEQVPKTSVKKSAVGKEEVAKLVDDIYRKMQVSGATDLASKGQGVLDSSKAVIKGEMDESFQLDTKVRCPCGSSLLTESMIKCEDLRCQVWQHIRCVIIPEKPMEGIPQVPDLFYCEICRLCRADPFWVTVAHPLYPVKLATTNIPSDGSSPVQSVEKTFNLTRADKDLLTKQEYDVQAWCMLLNDKVPFRMQWPQYADLQVNGVPVRAINRPGSQLLGANGRDDGPIVTPCTKDGINKISLTGCDARIFCLGVRIVKRRTVQQILNLIPKESDGEHFEDALARVCRCVGGGAADNADSDSDLEVVADSFTVSLRCPMSGSRMKVAGRFKPCAHMGCFDLEVFVEMNQRSRKWQCPICLKNYSLENVIIDPYFNRVTSKMWHCGEDTTEIEVKPDGSWRVKTKTEAERRDVGELAQWHYPDGSPCAPNGGEVKAKVEMEKLIRQEGPSDCHNGTGLKLGIRKNRNGFWEVSKPEDVNTSSSGNKLQEKLESHEQKVIPMSSSATGSGRDGEDPSVNQDGGGNFDFTNNGIELDSLSLNVDSAYEFTDRNISAPIMDAEVIVLSDSDDDNDLLMPPGALYKNNQTGNDGAAFPMAPPEIANPYTEYPTDGNGLGFLNPNDVLNPNDDEFGIPHWLPPGSQGGPGFQFLNSDVPGAFIDLDNGPINCPMSMNGYALAPNTVMGPAGLVPDSSIGRSDTDMNDGLVDNPLQFGGEDPSLQIFLPTRPSDASGQSDLRDQADMSNGVHTEDWISLSLGGGGATGNHSDSIPENGLNSRKQVPSREGAMESLADTASLLLGMNNGRSEKASRQRSDSPFTFPRPKRSVRQRLYLSIDSDSDSE